LQLPSHLSRSKLKWQNSLNRHCTYVFIQFSALCTPARIFSMLNVRYDNLPQNTTQNTQKHPKSTPKTPQKRIESYTNI
jgi:hypothetical protein